MGESMWVGVDVGKAAHHCVVLDDEGTQLLSARVRNTEAALSGLLDAVSARAAGRGTTWAVDIKTGPIELMLALLHARGDRVVYLPGRAFHYAAQAYPGERKTDARDAAVIADQARMRRDLCQLNPIPESIAALKTLLAYRAAISQDRVRAINRLRAHLSAVSPELEGAFDYAHNRGAVVLVSHFPSAAAITHVRDDEMLDALAADGVRNPHTLVETARVLAGRQAVSLPGHDVTEALIRRQAHAVLALHVEVRQLDKDVTVHFRRHSYAPILESMPGFGPHLGAEFLVGIAGSIDNYSNADSLAGACGLIPIPRDSGNVVGRHRRPRRYDRRLLRACYRSAESAARHDDHARTFYQRKRQEGKVHQQAVIALARRRIPVIWAMLRDRTEYGRLPTRRA
ncbi:IS110 family RNA-guided transposase [Nocardia tengchongensis]|uniref:IS110 family transposase n=1 Tax=Nocardia tengchongensis TaxID=2055889 RepID=UPI0036BC4509